MFIKRLLCLSLALLPLTAQAAAPVSVITTTSGVTAWLIEDHTLPMITLRAVFRHGGAAYGDPARPGLPKLAEAMLSEGAGDLSSQAFNEALQREAIQLGYDVGYDRFTIGLTTLSEHFGRGLELATLGLAKPRLEEADLARVKEALATERKIALQQPRYLADRLFRKTVYAGHPYAVSTFGGESAIAGYTADDIRGWLAQTLHRGDLIVAVVGDITPEALSAALDKSFGTLPGGDAGKTALPPTALPAGALTHQDAPLPQTVVAFAEPGLDRHDPDFYAAYLMNNIFGGPGLDARLTREVRKKGGYTYDIQTNFVLDEASKLLQGGFSTRSAEADKAVAAMRATFQAAYDKGFTETELEQSKNYITGSFPLNIDSDESLINYLVTMQVMNLPTDYLDIRNSLMRKVTLADVNRVARRLLDPAKLVVVTLGDNKAAASPSAKAGP